MTGKTFTYEGLEELERLQADMRVILAYEEKLRVALTDGEQSKATLESME